MNQEEMRSLLRLNVDDIQGDIFTDQICLLYLNQAVYHIHNELVKSGIYLSAISLEVEFTTNQEESISTDLQKVLGVFDSNGYPVNMYPEERSKRSNEISVYFHRGVIGYYRVPTSTFTYTIRYVPRITVFESADDTDRIITIPIEHHAVIVMWATVLALGKDEHKLNYWSQIYQQAFDVMIESVPLRPQTDQMVVDYDYGNY